jgi:hypothetical protein
MVHDEDTMVHDEGTMVHDEGTMVHAQMHSEHSSLIYSFTIHTQQEKMIPEISAKIANVNGLKRDPWEASLRPSEST